MTLNEKIIAGTITIMFSIISGYILDVLKVWFPNILPKKKLTLFDIKNRAIKRLWGSLKYILSFVIIIYWSVRSIHTPSALNFFMLSMGIILLMFTLLMSHVKTIYRMITKLTGIASDNDEIHKEAINEIFKNLGIGKKIG